LRSRGETRAILDEGAAQVFKREKKKKIKNSRREEEDAN